MRRAGEIEENRRQDEPVARVEEQTETKRPRLKLTYLYELIEALREDHRQLSARVDELSKLLDTAERWNSQAQAAAAHETTPAETPGAEGMRAAEREAEAAVQPDGGPLAMKPAAGHRYVWWIEETTPEGRAMQFGAGASLRADARAPAGEAPPGVRLQAAADAGEGRAPDELPGLHAAAIWAGVEQAIGNAAAALSAEQEAAPEEGADPNAAQRREWAPAELPAAERSRADDGSVPDEALLLELQEAARIADEIAAHASRNEAPAHGPAPALLLQQLPDEPAAPQQEASPEAAESAQAGPARAREPVGPTRISAHLPEHPVVTASRAERHQSKKRSLWSRLFARQA